MKTPEIADSDDVRLSPEDIDELSKGLEDLTQAAKRVNDGVGLDQTIEGIGAQGEIVEGKVQETFEDQLVGREKQGEKTELKSTEKEAAEQEPVREPERKSLIDTIAELMKDKEKRKESIAELFKKLHEHRTYAFINGKKCYLELKGGQQLIKKGDKINDIGQRDLEFEVYDAETNELLEGEDYEKWNTAKIKDIKYRDWKKGKPEDDEVKAAFRDDIGNFNSAQVAFESDTNTYQFFSNTSSGGYFSRSLEPNEIVKYIDKDGNVAYALRTPPREVLKSKGGKNPVGRGEHELDLGPKEPTEQEAAAEESLDPDEERRKVAESLGLSPDATQEQIDDLYSWYEGLSEEKREELYSGRSLAENREYVENEHLVDLAEEELEEKLKGGEKTPEDEIESSGKEEEPEADLGGEKYFEQACPVCGEMVLLNSKRVICPICASEFTADTPKENKAVEKDNEREAMTSDDNNETPTDGAQQEDDPGEDKEESQDSEGGKTSLREKKSSSSLFNEALSSAWDHTRKYWSWNPMNWFRSDTDPYWERREEEFEAKQRIKEGTNQESEEIENNSEDKEDFEFEQECPSCGIMVSANSGMIGKKIDCPRCKYRFITQKPEESESDVEQEEEIASSESREAGEIRSFKQECPSCETLYEMVDERDAKEYQDKTGKMMLGSRALEYGKKIDCMHCKYRFTIESNKTDVADKFKGKMLRVFTNIDI